MKRLAWVTLVVADYALAIIIVVPLTIGLRIAEWRDGPPRSE